MSNWNKESILEFISQYGGQAPVGRCLSIANDFEDLTQERFLYMQALAILSSLLLNEKGEVKKEYQGNRKAVQWALSRVSYCNAWVVCGPISDGMERMMKSIEKKIEEGTLEL